MNSLLNRICKESKVPKKRSSVRTHAVAFSVLKKAKPVELNCLRLVSLFIFIEGAGVLLVTASSSHAGWYGPARIVGVEKQGDPEDNMSQGSIICVGHGTTLRKVTRQLQDSSNHLKLGSVYQGIKNAGNKTNHRDTSQELEDEPMDSENHEDEPPQQQQSPQTTSNARLIRANYRHAARYGIFPRPADSKLQQKVSRQGHCLQGGEPLQESPAERAGSRDDHQGSLSWPNCESGFHRTPGVRDLADPTQESRTQLQERWEEMTPATMKESTNQRDPGDVLKSMMGAFSELKLRLDVMQQSSSQQQVPAASSSELERHSADPDKPREPKTPAQSERVPSAAQVSLSES